MIDKIPYFILQPIMSLGDKWSWFGNKLNAFAINSIVNVSRHRPHPWSTAHDYVSWTSLTDQRFSARHLPAKRLPNLPDPAQLVGLFQQSPANQILSTKSTCLFPAFAQYLTDGFIRTRMPDTSAGETDDVRRQTTSNHQIDMCPLYGRLPKQTDALRLKSESRGERGRLKSQFIGDEEYAPFLYEGKAIKTEFIDLDKPLGLDRILAILADPVLHSDPDEVRSRIFAFGGDRANAAPQVAMMNTLFLREHNRLAGDIERAHQDWGDERVFQTARNSLIVLFIKIVVEEYINHISPSFRFRANPSVAWNAPWNKPNWMTTEFSLLYRWHSLIPNTIGWNGKPYPLIMTLMNNRPLLDAGLAIAFSNMSSQNAGKLGAFNTAKALLHLEEDAIKQGRQCDLATYSDYREYVSLSRPKDFSDISGDPEVVAFLKNAYKSVNDIDFYVGLFAEDNVINSPLPPLLLRLVAVDAFSQALTNPLLSEHVFNVDTFSKPGWEAIQNTHTLRDILTRNCPAELGNSPISMTVSNWKRA
ncbi:MAG: peroxidase family protein [Pyrinomonadaceae bacterium]